MSSFVHIDARSMHKRRTIRPIHLRMHHTVPVGDDLVVFGIVPVLSLARAEYYVECGAEHVDGSSDEEHNLPLSHCGL